MTGDSLQHLAELRNIGWTVLPEIIPASQLQAVHDSVLQTAQQHATNHGGVLHLPALLNHDRTLAPYLAHPLLLELLEAQLGPGVRITFVTSQTNAADVQRGVWHADFPCGLPSCLPANAWLEAQGADWFVGTGTTSRICSISRRHTHQDLIMALESPHSGCYPRSTSKLGAHWSSRDRPPSRSPPHRVYCLRSWACTPSSGAHSIMGRLYNCNCVCAQAPSIAEPNHARGRRRAAAASSGRGASLRGSGLGAGDGLEVLARHLRPRAPAW